MSKLDPAAEVRRIVEEHEEWDSPHYFLLYKEDHVDVMACIMPDVDPGDYGRIMGRLAEEAGPGSLYVLQIEGYGVTQPPPGTAERAAFAEDKRPYREREESSEVCIAIAADASGSLWEARKIRGEDGIEEAHYPEHFPSGRLTDAIVKVATTYGER